MTATAPLPAADEVFVIPASFSQQRLWFLDQLEPDQPAYNMPMAARLRGLLDLDALDRALNGLLGRHEALRTSFRLVDGEPHQVVHSTLRLAMTVEDLSGLSDPGARAQELAAAEALRPFDLRTAPLLRATVLRLGEQDHVLLLTLHHIVADGWSVGILNRELSALYGALSAGEDLSLPELELQYGDFAVWQRECMQEGVLDRQLEYWRTELEGAPTLLEMPLDRPRPRVQSYKGAIVRAEIAPDVVQRLRALAQEQGATSFMTFLAAFGTLLSRYSGQQDLVVATPVAGRNRVELESLVGFFANTLALRIRLADRPGFRQLLANVRETALGAYANQDVPFEKLVEELNPARKASHSPVAQVLIAMQNFARSSLALPGVQHEPFGTERETSKFDLALFLIEGPDSLQTSLQYCTDLFDGETAERLLHHYHRILAEIAADPDRPVDELPLLEGDERRSVIRQAAGAPPAVTPNRCVHEIFRAQAALTPGAVAVEDGRTKIAYGDLWARARQLAARLRGGGVSSGDVVAVAAERSIDLVVAVLAVLEAGAAYLPVDPAYPEDRIAFMLADSGAQVMLTQESVLSTIPHEGRTVMIIDAEGDIRVDDVQDAAPATADDLAYVLYTSGSTGRPKGVAMPHRALANMLAWQHDSWTPPNAARTLQFAALSFDVSFQEIFSTLCSGGTLVLVSDEERRDPEALLTLLDERRIERLFIPFVALDQLAEACRRSGLIARELREVFTAGEQLKCTPAVRHMFERHVGCVLYNQYGPTETHVITQHKLEGAPATWPALPPIGHPIAGAEVHVLDDHGEPVPVGVEGELYLGGLPVARGYVGRPELTAERFVPNPFVADPNARLYRSGDRGRRRADGSIQYVGRRDDQVKIRGHRLELGEVEALLAQHPGVRAAAVAAHSQSSGERRLVGYIVPVSRPGPSPGELRAFLRQALPEPSVPAAYAVLAALPLTPSGKVDRRNLPLPDDLQLERREFIAPRDEIERAIAEMWQEVLELDEPVGVLDGFFDLGGHSLLAVRLFASIRRRLGVWLPLAELFQESTLEHLARLVRQELESGKDHRPWASPVQLQRGQPGWTPLFVMPTIHGDLLHYRPLVSKLDVRRPVYGLLQRGIDGRSAPHNRIEDMAADYVKEIRSIQPYGPYLLTGFCMAGVVAFQTAKLLEDEGEQIELVLLIDSSPFGHRSKRTRGQKEKAYIHDFLVRDHRAKWSWFAMRLTNMRQKVRDRLWFAIFDAWARTNRQRPPWLQDMWLVNDRTIKQFVTPHANFKAVQFRCGAANGHVSRWAKLARGGFEEVEIDMPGIDHEEMLFEPFVSVLAEEFNAQLERVGAPEANVAH